jgi:hypothetical protein
MSKTEKIVSIAAEGGSIVLYGQKSDKGEWQFSRGVEDQTPTFLDEGDGQSAALKHTSRRVTTWEKALGLLHQYPWAMLAGMQVHPAFRERVWEEV